MKDVVEIWVIKDPDGNLWKTPKGKSSWASQGAAKNAWLYHKNLHCKSSWSEDAQGWSCECVAKYDLVKREQ